MDNETSVTQERKVLDPSELGTRDYWEAAYTRELQNNSEDASDEGVIWFDESNAEDTVLTHLSSYRVRGLLDHRSCRFLDLGTGNGHMLFALRESEDDDDGLRWTGDMVGVDYSAKSVVLAQQLDAQRLKSFEGEAGDCAPVQFKQWDLLTDDSGDWLRDAFHVVLDKGTFDAISLMPRSGHLPHPCDVYRERVVTLIKPGHFLFITSCNWTKDELVDWLVSDSDELALFDEAKYPTFTFGGQTGQSVVTAVFRRRQQSARSV